MSKPWRTGGALIGLATAAVALGVSEVVAIATGPRSAPLVAVGAVVVDSAPEQVTRFAIDVFGVYNRLALLVGTLVLLGAVAAGLGPPALRRPWIGMVGLAGLGALGVAAAVTRHNATATAALPTVAGVLAAAGFFLLVRPRLVGTAGDRAGPELPGEQPEEPPTEPRTEQTGPAAGPAAPPARQEPAAPAGAHARRDVFRWTGLAIGAAALAGVGGRWAATQRGLAVARGAVDLPSPADAAPPVPAAANLQVPGATGYVTSNEEFYRIDTALVVPGVDPEQWTLRVHGRVRRPFEITFAELLARPMLERYITLACVSNPVGGDLIDNARWLGVPVADLLAEAEPLPGADQVVSRSVDGWTCGTPTEVLTDGRDALLAIGMNGQPLPPEHGFPARMVVPGLYGYVSACKWIVEIELTSFDDYDAYWVPRGWAPRAPIKTQSRIDTPRGEVSAGAVTVAGVAWAQHRGVQRVEVRVDEGPWQEATLAETLSADTWRMWSWQWPDAAPGEHTLTVRATDATGEAQPELRSSPAPDGATGWHQVRVSVS